MSFVAAAVVAFRMDCCVVPVAFADASAAMQAVSMTNCSVVAVASMQRIVHCCQRLALLRRSMLPDLTWCMISVVRCVARTM